MQGSKWIVACLLTVVSLIQGAAAQTADQHVTFDTAPYVLGQIQRRLALERGEMVVATGQTIDGYLSKPEGDGPFAAIVYLHGCAGLGDRARQYFSRLLTGWGYVVLAVDSFRPRGLAQACDRPMPDRNADAWGALTYLASLPFVDRSRIGLVGSSQGGIVTLRLVSKHDVKIYELPDDLTFKVAVAYYPRCSSAGRWLVVPTLILIGDKDDWTPAANCEQWLSLQPTRVLLSGWRSIPAPITPSIFPGWHRAGPISGTGCNMRPMPPAARSQRCTIFSRRI